MPFNDKTGEIDFTPKFDPRPTEGHIHGEWGDCVSCGTKGICLKVYVVGTDMDSVDVCQQCVNRVFAAAFTYYRERDDQIVDVLRYSEEGQND